MTNAGHSRLWGCNLHYRWSVPTSKSRQEPQLVGKRKTQCYPLQYCGGIPFLSLEKPLRYPSDRLGRNADEPNYNYTYRHDIVSIFSIVEERRLPSLDGVLENSASHSNKTMGSRRSKSLVSKRDSLGRRLSPRWGRVVHP